GKFLCRQFPGLFPLYLSSLRSGLVILIISFFISSSPMRVNSRENDSTVLISCDFTQKSICLPK
ncbi:hypothetical protein, partial [Klebsiella pneumoniae]|uniref:hypothetical protein n=1 Tax=Klebsiella pneumoniae TaxID=573 RepID=UPI00405578F1